MGQEFVTTLLALLNAAERLGLKEGTLRARMKKLDIHRP